MALQMRANSVETGGQESKNFDSKGFGVNYSLKKFDATDVTRH